MGSRRQGPPARLASPASRYRSLRPWKRSEGARRSACGSSGGDHRMRRLQDRWHVVLAANYSAKISTYSNCCCLESAISVMQMRSSPVLSGPVPGVALLAEAGFEIQLVVAL